MLKYLIIGFAIVVMASACRAESVTDGILNITSAVSEVDAYGASTVNILAGGSVGTLNLYGTSQFTGNVYQRLNVYDSDVLTLSSAMITTEGITPGLNTGISANDQSRVNVQGVYGFNYGVLGLNAGGQSLLNISNLYSNGYSSYNGNAEGIIDNFSPEGLTLFDSSYLIQKGSQGGGGTYIVTYGSSVLAMTGQAQYVGSGGGQIDVYGQNFTIGFQPADYGQQLQVPDGSNVHWTNNGDPGFISLTSGGSGNLFFEDSSLGEPSLPVPFTFPAPAPSPSPAPLPAAASAGLCLLGLLGAGSWASRMRVRREI